MTVDLRRLRRAELLVGILALALLADMFLPWYSAEVAFFGITARASGNAWRAYSVTDLLLLALVLAALGQVALTATQRAPALPLAAGLLLTLFAGVVALVVLVRMIDQVGPNAIVSDEIGIYLGFALCCAIAVAGFYSVRDEGTGVPGADARREELLRGAEVTPPPPRPEP